MAVVQIVKDPRSVEVATNHVEHKGGKEEALKHCNTLLEYH